MPRSLPHTWALRATALLAVVGTATACARTVDPSARSDRQAWKAMYQPTLDAVAAVAPGIKPDEFPDGHSGCHPSDFIGDSTDESEVTGSASISLDTLPSDKRSPTQLAREVATRMETKGWKASRSGGVSAVDGEVSIRLEMPGSGTANVTADHQVPAQALPFNRVAVALVTECLRNDDWHG